MDRAYNLSILLIEMHVKINDKRRINKINDTQITLTGKRDSCHIEETKLWDKTWICYIDF